MFLRKTSVVVIVIISLVTVSTLLLGTFGLIAYRSERERQHTKLQNDLLVRADQISAGLALPVWNFDVPQVDKILESVMRDQSIYGIVVVFADAKTTIHARVRDGDWNIRSLDQEFPTAGLATAERSLMVPSGTIGTVKIFATTKFVEAELNRTLLSTVANILALDLMMTLSLYLLLGRWVLWPLRKVEAFAVAVSSGKVAGLPKKPFHGELESLRNSIEKMIGQLESRYQEQQATEKVLRRQGAFDELLTGVLSQYASASGHELDIKIEFSLQEIARFLNAEYGVVIQLSNDFTKWSATHEWCAPGIECKRHRFQNVQIDSTGWTEQLLLSNKVVVIRSIDEIPKEADVVRQRWQNEGFKSMLQVPLRGRGGNVNGSIGILSCSREITWSEDDIRRFKILGDAVANTLERKRTEEALRQSREQLRALSSRLQSLREEERIRISREIHDHLGQLLTALKLDLRSLERKVSAMLETELTATLYSKINSAQKLTDETIVSVQKIASELRPGVLDRLGLGPAIEAELQTFQSRTGTKCDWHISTEIPILSPDHATAMFRIFQEILTNIARHAHATHVSVRLNCENGQLTLGVSDNGSGIQKGNIENANSLGILGMQERAAMLGGTIAFESEAGKGTTVTVQLPFDKKMVQP